MFIVVLTVSPTHLDVCTVYILLYLVSFLYLSCLMKVITASSKRCNKVCELFEQCMSEYQAGIEMISCPELWIELHTSY